MNFINCSDEYLPEFVEQAVYDDGDWFCGDTLFIYPNSSEDHGRERSTVVVDILHNSELLMCK